MKKIVSLITVLLIGVFAYGQPQENIWMFGSSNALDFSSVSPVLGGIPVGGGNPPAWNFDRSGAVCNSAGQLQFWVKLHYNTGAGAASITNIFRAGAQPMPNGQLRSDLPGQGVPVIVPMPGNNNRYYVFYIKNGGLLYSVVDMTLNGGLGDVLPAQKNIQLTGWGTLIDHKLLAVAGCNGIWIIVRKKNENQFLSYQLHATGISSTPVVSNAGLRPLTDYGSNNAVYAGVMKASSDGSRIAVAGNGQPLAGGAEQGVLELYDFEPCSGRLLHPFVLDTGSYYGVCFSADGSKLYATRIFERNLYQFDLSQPGTPAIIASKTLVFSNYVYPPVLPDRYLLGDLKLGNDGKIYLGNNVCAHPSYVNAMHVVSQPNLTGLACGLQPNALILGNAGACTGLDLPADIVIAPQQDTVHSSVKYIAACFKDSIDISAAPGAGCYVWDDSVYAQTVTIRTAGLHIARYTTPDCRLHMDSFFVSFPKMPYPGPKSYSCPGRKKGKLVMIADDTTTFRYEWKDQAGVTLRTEQSNRGDTLAQLPPGSYMLHLTSASGCDTILELEVTPLPEPDARFDAPAVACTGVIVPFHKTSPEPIWQWYFPDGTQNKDPNPDHIFLTKGTYTVSLVVRNIEGCTDTAEREIDIRDFDLQLTADKDYPIPGELVRLQTNGSEPYSITSWLPQSRFSNQTLFSQDITMDSSLVIIVTGQSASGCYDTTLVTVHVRPRIMIPSAFSPNGDGLNDLFRVSSWGEDVFIRFMEVYNRWGQLVYRGAGRSATGWDGTYKGLPADAGAYFYVIEIEFPDGKTFAQKGDVTLIR